MQPEEQGIKTEGAVSANDPFALFGDWFSEAKKEEPNDPEAMSLATVGEDMMPNTRMVLLKAWDNNGFVFYTNCDSDKGREMTANNRVALLFHWKSLRRQVRIRGLVESVSESEADSYFKSRPRNSRVGAWASQQSRPLTSLLALEKAVAKYALKFGIGEIPRPAYWRGYRVFPLAIEFWKDRPFRLHERIVFTRVDLKENWKQGRLYP